MRKEGQQTVGGHGGSSGDEGKTARAFSTRTDCTRVTFFERNSVSSVPMRGPHVGVANGRVRC